MRLTVLGSSASFPGPRRACAGHLVSAEGVHVVFDLGNGTLANLSTATDPYAIDAVFITHLHPDHFLDLFALMAMVRYAPEGTEKPISVFAPEGLHARMAALLTGHGRQDLADAFEWTTLRDREAVDVGPMRVMPSAVDHERPTFALVAQAAGKRLCYTSDSRLSQPVRDAAAGCDLLLSEATLPQAYSGRAPHMTPAEAGELASTSGATTLVLTHLWPTVPRDAILREATAVFGGQVVLADELATIEV
jgi:ribonuclease BN (tRNA processing enzyme)